MKLIIEDDEGRQTVVPFVRDEITIGRLEGNTIRLTERNVSRRHARLVRQNGHVVVEDLGSSYGIHINGKRIREPFPVSDGDLIQIGDYDLAIQAEGQEATAIRKRPEREPSDADGDEEGLSAGDEPTANAPAPAIFDDPSRRPTAVIPAAPAAPATPARGSALSLDPEQAPRLVVLNTSLAGREFACIRTELQIGKADENDISIDHSSLSARHARLWLDDETWKLVDLGTVNGISHNDAPCQEASLQSGDLLEVGAVRFKFVGPGVAFRFDPKAEYRPPKRGHKGKIIGAVVGIAVLGAAGLGWRLLHRTAPPRVVTAQAPHVAQPVQPQHPSGMMGAAALTAAASLQQAQEAIAQREFAKGVALLEGIQNPSAEDAARITPLLTQARGERDAQLALASAKDAITRADYKGARTALTGAAKTQVFGAERDALARQISDAQTDALYEQGREELKTGKFREATRTFNRCLSVDGTAARCHMLLGASFAQLAASDPDARSRSGELDKAVAHYRKFLQYAGPDDSKEAEKVKSILKSYEGKRK